MEVERSTNADALLEHSSVPDRKLCHDMSMDADRRRERKRAFKHEEQLFSQQTIALGEASLSRLLAHLDARLSEVACDHSLRLTLAWAEENGVKPDELVSSLEQFGGYCDCEVLANVELESIF
jgi:hypothetical protein